MISVPVLSAQKEKQNDIAVLQKEDAAGPVYLSVEVGQDTRVFDGQPFISFVARDSGSGVAYYEISEQGEKFTTEDTVYVLKHPATKGVVSITAVDHVGNKTKTEIYVGAKPYSRTIMVFVAIGLVLGIFVWRFVFRKKHEVVQ